MASFFRGSIQSTPLQQAIEKATDGSQTNEDWGLIMKICDHVGIQDENAKEAMKVIRKRLQINPTTSGWRTIGLTLTLLEALTKNCGKVFHLQIAQKDFLNEFQSVLIPKNNPPLPIQEKVLGMIQTWAVAFHNDPDLKAVEQFYQECKQQGIEFPPAEPENIIKTAISANKTIEDPVPHPRPMPQPGPGLIPNQNRSPTHGPAQQMGHNQPVLKQMMPEQVAKLRSELDVVQVNAQVLGEMLITLQPGEEHPNDLEFLLELHKTCKQMQLRIVELLSQITADDITVDLLRYNDEFNNSFKIFESYMQERQRRVGSNNIPILNQTIAPPQPTFVASVPKTAPFASMTQHDNGPALIKFDDEPAKLSSGVQNLNINTTPFDTTPKNIQPQITASVRTRSVSSNHEVENDVKEVEQWLNTLNDKQPNNTSENGTTDAFNEFIGKRAASVLDQPVSELDININLQETTPKENEKDQFKS